MDCKKYAQELKEIQERGAVVVKLCPIEAVAIINHVQLSATNTGNYKITQVAIAGAKKIQEAVLDPESTAYEVLEAGWKIVEQSQSPSE
jgi:hypothetical protein